MFGIILVICIYIVLGFMLAWIAGVVAKEEVEVKTGVLILIIAGILNLFTSFALDAYIPETRPWSDMLLSLAILTLAIHVLANLTWKHSAIIAVIYSIIIGLVFFGLGSCMVG